MWIISCEDESLLDDKRLWLRPGTDFLIGRNNPSLESNQRSRTVNLKSISRHHLTIRIKDVVPGSSTLLHQRPEIEVEDHSKIGTSVDGGLKFAKDKVTLTGKRHELLLGNWDKKIVVEWCPVVFAATSLGKKSKDPIAEIRAKVEKFGFKVTAGYETGITTHVVAIKRNIPQVLNALVDAKYVVTPDFVDRVIDCAQPNGALEQDTNNWPSESNFLPPAGKEPKPRPADLLMPNTARKDVFAGYSFVFCDAKQFESLIGPITCGSGKAMLYESFNWGHTTPQDFATFVKNAAGEKDAEELDQGGQSKGVVVVRLGDSKDPHDEAWRVTFIAQSDLLLGQRSMLQNEFLDAIIMCDAKDLKKPLEEEIDVASTAPAPSAPQTSQTGHARASIVDHHARENATSVSQQENQQAMPQTARKPRRPMPRTRFGTFDDFNPSQVSKPVDLGDDDEIDRSQRPGASQFQGGRTDSKSAGGNDHPMENIDEESDEGFDRLLPGAAEAKRRRLEHPVDRPDMAVKPSETAAALMKKRQREASPNLDVLEAVKKRKTAQESAANEDEETIKEMMAGMDIESIRGLAQIEEMDVPNRLANRRDRPAVGDDENNDRWKPEWNGRKNFKRFRRKGEAGEPALRGHKVIIPLEEVSRRSRGIGDEYWLNSNSSKSKSQSQRNETLPRRHSVNQEESDDESDEDATRFRNKRSTQNGNATPMESDKDAEEAEVEEDTTTNRSAQRSSRASKIATATQTGRSQPVATKTSSKRPAADEGEGRATTKRTRTTKSSAPVITVSDSDDDDGLRFKFSRKK